jgi:hypothetical protein
MSSRKIFEYLIVAVVATLIAVNLAITRGNWHQLLLDVLPNLIAGLIGFIAIYLFFTRRRMSISEMTGDTELRREFRKRVIPAARSLEMAIRRSTEAYSIMSQTAALHSNVELFAALTYRHQVMSTDIFEAYSILLQHWMDVSTGADLVDPMLKANEFTNKACEHCDALIEGTRFLSGAAAGSLATALSVLKDDLRSACRETDIEHSKPASPSWRSDGEPNQAMQRTAPRSNA